MRRPTGLSAKAFMNRWCRSRHGMLPKMRLESELRWVAKHGQRIDLGRSV
jgi:hypothetical protein